MKICRRRSPSGRRYRSAGSLRLVMMCVLSTLASCGGGEGGGGGIVQPRSQPALTGISVTPTSLALEVTQTGALQAALSGPGATSGSATTSFTSSAAAVATVSATGQVTAVGPGVASITVTGSHPTAGNLTASTVTTSVSVTVSSRPVASLSLALADTVIEVGKTTQATAAARSASGAVIPEAIVSFASSVGTVATVSPSGLVTAIAPGTTLITATAGSQVRTVSLTVNPVFVAIASIQPFSIASTVGGTSRSLTVVPLDASGAPLSNRQCAWTSTQPSVGAVTSPWMTSTLTVAASLARTTAVTISVACEGRSASATFNATPIPVASIALTRDSTFLAHDETGFVRVTFRDAQNNALSGREAIFFDTTGLVGTPPGGAWTSCANEGQTCTVSGRRLVRYGAGSSFTYRTVTGAIVCSIAAFSQDPAPNVAKSCAQTAPSTSADGRIAVTALHCFFDNCPRGVRNAFVRVEPVENPNNVSVGITQQVVPAFMLTQRAPVDTGPLSIETTQTLTFSNAVATAGVGSDQVALRETVAGTLIQPSAAFSVVNNVITYQPNPLKEDTRYTFTYTSLLRDVYGKAVRNPGSFQYRTVLMDKLYYYLLTNAFSGPQGRAFAVNSTTGLCTTAIVDQNDQRQQWYVAPYNATDPGLDIRLSSSGARVRLRNRFYGETRNLEAAAPNGQCQMNTASANRFGGEEWRARALFGFRTYLQVGDDAWALDQPGGGLNVGLAATGNFSGQVWTFTRLGRR